MLHPHAPSQNGGCRVPFSRPDAARTEEEGEPKSIRSGTFSRDTVGYSRDMELSDEYIQGSQKC